MKVIDLRDYARATEKLPPQALVHQGRRDTTADPRRVFGAFLVDAYLVLVGSMLLATALELGVDGYLLVDAIREGLSESSALALYPLSSLGYFFFAVLLNGGQTQGMRIAKVRLHVTDGVLGAARTALRCFGLITTLGLAWPALRSRLVFRSHDHLYQTLLEDRTLYPVDLVAAAAANAAVVEEPARAA